MLIETECINKESSVSQSSDNSETEVEFERKMTLQAVNEARRRKTFKEKKLNEALFGTKN